MVIISLPDGSKRKFDEKPTVLDVAKSIGTRLAKDAIAGKVNGNPVDLVFTIENDSEVEIITNSSEEAAEIIRHSTAHIMAQAVLRLFPETKVTIGPSIENGFYYDFDSQHNFNEEDLEKIEDEMRKIVAEDYPFQKSIVKKEEAIQLFKEKDENYKVEIIHEIESPNVNLYKQGEFIDLCRGPHVPSTKFVKAFKLTHVAGAYWRGDSNNEMLQRIYGYAFPTEKELKKHLKFLEEAEKRDHRKLGKELELFFLSEYGPGFPFWLPKGMELMTVLKDVWMKEHKKAGYKMIQTPIMLNKDLWETSGHWYNYRDNMYTSDIDKYEFAIKPMNCPGGILVYQNEIHSYKDFPLRIGELGHVHRHELSGALHGLFRVRAFTQDDAHIYMTPEQIEDEVNEVIDLYEKFYSLFDLKFHIELSTMPDKAIGSKEVWEQAEKALENAILKSGREFKLNPGDGAFYGPKLDFKLQDAIGRIWQCGTIQLDFNLPERFNLNYIGEDGEKHQPVMIHRAMYGSLERFIGILIEHYAGGFPVWLAPVQVKLLTISEEQEEYADEIAEKLRNMEIRIEKDYRNEKIGFKIREANAKEKVPIQIILGKNEMEEKTVNLRRFGSKKSSTLSLDNFYSIIEEESEIKF